MYCPGDHAIKGRHGICLTTARLTIAEDADIVPIEGTLYELADFVEHFSILSRGPEDAIKGEIVVLSGDGAESASFFWTQKTNLFALF
jgi:hypothetical protein